MRKQEEEGKTKILTRESLSLEGRRPSSIIAGGQRISASVGGTIVPRHREQDGDVIIVCCKWRSVGSAVAIKMS